MDLQNYGQCDRMEIFRCMKFSKSEETEEEYDAPSIFADHTGTNYFLTNSKTALQWIRTMKPWKQYMYQSLY